MMCLQNLHPYCVWATIIAASIPLAIAGWGGSSSNSYNLDVYSDANDRDWLQDGSVINIKLEGCSMGNVDQNFAEDMACMEDESDEGTYYWYQMANCQRAQAVFSIYAGSSGSCGSSSYKETFITRGGVSEFIGYMQSYDPYSPFGENGAADDDDGGNDAFDFDNLPICEESGYGYLGVGCNEDGTYEIHTFNDQYCLQSTGVFDELYKFNKLLNNYKTCTALSASDDGDFSYVIPYVETCSSLDSQFCTDDADMADRLSSTSSNSGGFHLNSHHTSSGKSWGTKLKYGIGALLLVGSFIMFTGILFTNRRRRRALIQRKYRMSKRGETSKSVARSKSRDAKRSRSSKRSKSRNRGGDDGGVLT